MAMNTYDVYISRVESVVVRVEADDEMFAIFLADEYVTFPEDKDNVNWDMDYNYTFNPVLIEE
jgi:urate oxidase